jgi:3-phenylpropionate/trans-cinnamate dioxygenase ferredoxin subunit
MLTGGAVEGDVVICPRHGARFCIRTGKVLAPPAYEDVVVFPVRIEAGVVQVRDDRWD